jgi:phage terminase large subunit-like protein
MSSLLDDRRGLERLTPEQLEQFERRVRWVEYDARPEQLTPLGDWKTWLLLAGRGFGKTRTAAEDVAAYGLDNPKSFVGVVAETFADGRDVCIEGESGLLSVLPPSSVRHWNRSIGELYLTNDTKYRLFSGDKPDGLRGYQFHRLWWDELAKFIYAQEAWNQGQLGLRLGSDPRNVVTTTPRPILLIRDLVERENVVVTAGSTFDNEANLAPSFIEEIRRQYEGTKLGDQELHGKIVLLDGESYFKSEWFPRYTADEAPGLWNAAVGHFAAMDTAETINVASAYSALVVGSLQKNYQMPIRHVARQKLEFPDLVDWTIAELTPFARDFKLKAVFIEDASSGRQLSQTLIRSGPKWLRSLIVPVKPKRGGKEESWKAASVWAKRGMTPLPDPTVETPWAYDFESELFALPNSPYKDQGDSYAELVNEVEARYGAFSQRWRALSRIAAV